MDDSPPPDRLEKGLRFGGGSVFGGIFLNLISERYLIITGRPLWITVGIGAVICGLIAIRYGDRFYHGILDFFRSIWW